MLSSCAKEVIVDCTMFEEITESTSESIDGRCTRIVEFISMPYEYINMQLGSSICVDTVDHPNNFFRKVVVDEIYQHAAAYFNSGYLSYFTYAPSIDEKIWGTVPTEVYYNTVECKVAEQYIFWTFYLIIVDDNGIKTDHSFIVKSVFEEDYELWQACKI